MAEFLISQNSTESTQLQIDSLKSHEFHTPVHSPEKKHVSSTQSGRVLLLKRFSACQQPESPIESCLDTAHSQQLCSSNCRLEDEFSINDKEHGNSISKLVSESHVYDDSKILSRLKLQHNGDVEILESRIKELIDEISEMRDKMAKQEQINLKRQSQLQIDVEAWQEQWLAAQEEINQNKNEILKLSQRIKIEQKIRQDFETSEMDDKDNKTLCDPIETGLDSKSENCLCGLSSENKELKKAADSRNEEIERLTLEAQAMQNQIQEFEEITFQQQYQIQQLQNEIEDLSKPEQFAIESLETELISGTLASEMNNSQLKNSFKTPVTIDKPRINLFLPTRSSGAKYSIVSKSSTSHSALDSPLMFNSVHSAFTRDSPIKKQRNELVTSCNTDLIHTKTIQTSSIQQDEWTFGRVLETFFDLIVPDSS